MQEKHTPRTRDILLIASVIFGMFFGAGNLIFPIQLGQSAGSNWILATLGFLVTGTLVPYLAMLAISVTKSESAYDLAKPVAPWFGMALLVLIHLTLGPLVATPRTAATGFTMGVAPFLPESWQGIGMIIFSFIFFALAILVSITNSRITDWVGRYLTPLFLILIIGVIIIGLLNPMGDLNQPVASAYQSTPFMTGFLDGYNTLDGVALLALAVSVVYAVRGLGYRDQAISSTIAKAGLLSIMLEALIYTALIVLGVASLTQLKLADNGGIALMQIIQHYFGTSGSILTGILVILAVFTTAVGLLSSFAHDMHLIFNKISYNGWLIISSAGSFLTANLGLTNIIKWSSPLLMFIYPFVLTLIFLALIQRFFNGAPIVYRLTMLFVAPMALMDGLASAPFASSPAIANLVSGYHHLIPFASAGFGWILPALIGFGLSLIIWHFQKSV
ncbi:branched-chain amino acid transport system II carrier protein [Weissella minor]|uniref:branched-chain amino acid transport system II carrier protein n=1 Tax=Weissella minor TaxID=1620 RepID=UPI001BAFC31E|nr:branched-chain amino acid transport system II carrier protein [Weissella minor]MBS0949311.1 branched-chain amino acid transport system II carrier protein [Weissella minor]